MMGQSSQKEPLLLSANRHLEQLYFHQKNPCLALHISRNYQLLLLKYEDKDSKKSWQLKAKLWWDLYCSEQKNTQLFSFNNEAELLRHDFYLTL